MKTGVTTSAPTLFVLQRTRLDDKRERFDRFHAANPRIYDSLLRLARKLKARGVTRYSIHGLLAVVRYLETKRAVVDSDEPFYINNDFAPLYARLLMEREPDLGDFFETRALISGERAF
jgi:hypothetical protein